MIVKPRCILLLSVFFVQSNIDLKQHMVPDMNSHASSENMVNACLISAVYFNMPRCRHFTVVC